MASIFGRINDIGPNNFFEILIECIIALKNTVVVVFSTESVVSEPVGKTNTVSIGCFGCWKKPRMDVYIAVLP